MSESTETPLGSPGNGLDEQTLYESSRPFCARCGSALIVSGPFRLEWVARVVRDRLLADADTRTLRERGLRIARAERQRGNL